MPDLPENFIFILSIAAGLVVVAIVIIAIALYLRKLFTKRKLLKQEQSEFEALKQKITHTQILQQESYIAKQAEEQFRNQLVSLIEFAQKSLSSSTDELEKFLKELQQS